MQIDNTTRTIISIIERNGGKAFITGGACRDFAMGITPRDFDIEVFGISKPEICKAINEAGFAAKIAGASYPIVIATIEGEEIEISVATGTVFEAAERRDITANAIYFRPATGEWIDPFFGRDDIRNGIIRMTPQFENDPTRIMRVARFMTRFGWRIAPQAATRIRAMFEAGRMNEIAIERIWPEFAKAFDSERPGDFIRNMREIGIIEFFPEIANMIGIEQDPDWHPEGDAFEHTAFVMDAAATICRRDGITGEDRIAFIAGAMIHDCGKPGTTEISPRTGRIISPGHDQAGIAIAEAFFARCGISTSRIAGIAIAMTAEHMARRSEMSPRSIRRMAVRIASRGATITDIARIIEADVSGRPPRPAHMPEVARVMMEMASEMRIEAAPPARIIMGRHIMPFGIKPGPRIGRITKAAFEAQIDGEFEDEAGGIAWITARIDGIE